MAMPLRTERIGRERIRGNDRPEPDNGAQRLVEIEVIVVGAWLHRAAPSLVPPGAREHATPEAWRLVPIDERDNLPSARANYTLLGMAIRRPARSGQGSEALAVLSASRRALRS
jgi:hypothetical protein